MHFHIEMCSFRKDIAGKEAVSSLLEEVDWAVMSGGGVLGLLSTVLCSNAAERIPYPLLRASKALKSRRSQWHVALFRCTECCFRAKALRIAGPLDFPRYFVAPGLTSYERPAFGLHFLTLFYNDIEDRICFAAGQAIYSILASDYGSPARAISRFCGFSGFSEVQRIDAQKFPLESGHFAEMGINPLHLRLDSHKYAAHASSIRQSRAQKADALQASQALQNQLSQSRSKPPVGGSFKRNMHPFAHDLIGGLLPSLTVV